MGIERDAEREGIAVNRAATRQLRRPNESKVSRGHGTKPKLSTSKHGPVPVREPIRYNIRPITISPVIIALTARLRGEE